MSDSAATWSASFDVPWLCADGGICNHDCPAAACWRVHNMLAPLTGVFPGDEWPQEVREKYAAGGAP